MLNLLEFLSVVSPLVLVACLAISFFMGIRLSESAISTLCKSCVLVGLGASLAVLIFMLASGERRLEFHLADFVVLKVPGHHQHFHFDLRFVFDRLSVPMAIMSYVLCGTIGAFGAIYLHRESGYQRFFLFFSIFLAGMTLASLAFTIEALFLGWELVGLSSALLVAYFHDRPSPVRNGQRVWAVYRIADASFLIAAIFLHHLTGEGNFAELLGSTAWPVGKASLTEWQALTVGMLLLIAAAGKSALIPFSGWLPRAMEGPTPSSAVFYGALSVHLGAFLLMRASPILQCSTTLQVIIVLWGLATACYAVIVGRVQSDVKSALAFASLTQVGIIVAEIGMGWWYVALVHLLGHACMRSLQLLRAPNLLRDYRTIENAIGDHVVNTSPALVRQLPAGLQLRVFRFALERGYLDSLIQEWIVGPFDRMFRQFDRWERAWTDWLSGGDSRVSDHISANVDSEESTR